jgi:carbonic anhydrase
VGKDGPNRWGDLSPQYAQCSTGHQQSPIDISSASATPAPPELEPLVFAYGSVPLRAINNGHTIQVDVPGGNTIEVGGHRFRLVQFHFHAPSEETIDGVRHALVMHLVNEDVDGKKAVVAVLFDVGEESHALGSLFEGLPSAPGSVVARAGETLRVDELLPAKRGYFAYDGSLTTPPCTEGVEWFVLKQPLTLSARQLTAFRQIYPDNARPLQPRAGRAVRQTEP